jgi:Domain of unknown function (DUF6438)/Ankyrin repeats (3 copies)
MKAYVVFALVIGLARSATAQGSDIPPDTMIRLERTSCFGECPIYTVTIDARGTVTYEGDRFVRAVGLQTARIAPAVVATLLASAERIHFFDLRDAYRVIENPDGTLMMVTDLPTTFVTITVNGRTKRVEDYFGAPDGLAEFELEIDEAARTKRWIFFDEETLAALIRSGWSASSEEGATFLQQAIERDDIAIAHTLVERGAHLGGSGENRLPPLFAARSGAMVDLLVKAGADPNERPIGRLAATTALMKAYYKDAGVTEALLKAGARMDDLDSGQSALSSAACHGNWRVVALLLRAGANARGSADMSALDCARRSRQSEINGQRTILDRGRPTVEDFDQVIALLETAEKRIKR